MNNKKGQVIQTIILTQPRPIEFWKTRCSHLHLLLPNLLVHLDFRIKILKPFSFTLRILCGPIEKILRYEKSSLYLGERTVQSLSLDCVEIRKWKMKLLKEK